jgi:streptogramin lyase
MAGIPVRNLAWAATVLLAAMATAPTAAIPITEFTVPTASADPGGIAAGPDGDLWFTELTSNKIGRITTAGAVVNEYTSTGSLVTEFPAGITQGPDGAMWFAVYANNQIGRITTAGEATFFDIPTANSGPVDIVAGPDGNLWFTEFNGNKIGRVTTGGAFQEFTIPTAGAEATGITAGPDGNLWFGETGGEKIGRLTPAGAFKEFSLPDAASTPEPGKVTRGPDGNLWFTEINGSHVGRITPAGVFTEFDVPTPNAGCIVITAGADGNLWFTETGANQIASVTTAGVVTEYPVPTAQSGPGGIAPGPDGNIWFTEISGNKVARVTLASGGGACVANATTICIDDHPGDKRWQIGVSYETAQSGGLAGNGQAIPLSSLGVTEGGLFWFFAADNPEMLIKVINACAVNQRFWLFYSATTNVGFTVTVKDTRTPRTKTYSNKDGTAAPPVQDTSAFSCNAQGDVDTDSGASGEAAARVDANPDTNESSAVPAAATGCTANATTLCIDNRFQMKVTYKTAQGGGSAGNGQAIALTSLGVAQGGLFWFFSADNPEMLIKVIDGCSLNQKYWLFYAAGTNVGFTATVTDLQTNARKTYTNKDGVAAAPVQDTAALPCS